MTNIRKLSSKLGAILSCAVFLFAAALWLNCSTAPDSCGDDYEVFDPKYQKCEGGKITPIAPSEYTVKVSSEGTGALGGGEYPPYAAVTVTAGTPPSGRRFKEWTSSVAGVIFVPSANSPTVMFSMPASPVTVTAVFDTLPAAVKYKVNVESEGEDALGSGEYAPNDTVTVTAGTPPDGYQFERWISADSVTFVPSANNETVKFSMPARDVTVTAVYEEIAETASAYTITFDAGTGGTVTPASRVTDTVGRLASLPTPTKRGYTFGGWWLTADTSDTSATRVTAGRTGTVFKADTVIYARWAITNYTITYDSLTGAIVSPANPTSYTVDTATFTLNKPTRTGYIFAGWSWTEGDSTKMDTTVTIAKGSIGNKKYTANWLPAPANTYTLTVERNPTAGGSTTPSSSQSGISAGTKVTITATANPGYKFKNWTSADTITFSKADSVTATFTMPAKAVKVTANFEATGSDTAAKYKVTVISIGTGASDSGSYKAKDTVKIKAGTPPAGMTFKSWTSADTVKFNDSASAATWFIMPAKPVTVEANFMPQDGKISGDSLLYKNKKYPTVVMGGKTWMAANLNFDTLLGTGSWCYGDSAKNCEKYGRLYDWSTATKVCPTAMGWKLPDTADWNNLTRWLGGKDIAAGRLKAASGWDSTTNSEDNYGFSALPGGYYRADDDREGEDDDDESFKAAGKYGLWWTAMGQGDLAKTQIMSYNNVKVEETELLKSRGFSVRCVKTDPAPSPAVPALLSKAKRR